MSILEDKIAKVCGGYPKIAAAWLFGSQIHGNTRPDSDIDIGILVNAKLSTGELIELQQALAETLNSDGIDLTILNQAGPALRFEAICGRRVYCQQPAQTAVFQSLTSREYEELMATWERGLAQRRQLREQAGCSESCAR